MHFKSTAMGVIALISVGLAPAFAQTNMKIANVTPSSSPIGIVLKEVADELNARTDIDLKVEVFSDGVLGGSVETIDQLRSGAIQGQTATGISLFQVYEPEFGAEELPFMFANREAAYAAVDGEYGALITKKLDALGFKVLAYWENGYRNFTNSKRPIVKPEDMHGLRFRSAESPIRLAMFASLNANAVAMPFTELFAALQQNVVDGQENPLTLIDSSSFADVQKYLSISGHIWNAAPVVVSKVWWAGLDAATQDAIATAFDKAKTRARKLVADGDATLIEKLKADGMEVNHVDVAAFQEATKSVWDSWKDKISPELMAMVLKNREMR